MAKMKSLNLEGAKRAVRALFGRQSSTAASGNSGNSSEEGTNSTSNSTGNSAGNGGKEPKKDDVKGKSQGGGDSQLNATDTSTDTKTDTHSHSHADTSKHESLSAVDGTGANTRQGDKSSTKEHTVANQSSLKTDQTTDQQNDSSTPANMVAVATPLGQQFSGHQKTRSSINQKPAGKENQPALACGPGSDKENVPPNNDLDNTLVSAIGKLNIDEDGVTDVKQEEEVSAWPPDEELTEEDKALRAEREKHLVFIEEALDMARLALKINETPVGCVLVRDDKVIARGMNATNVTRNGTRHAEFMALGALLSYAPKNGPKTTSLRPRIDRQLEDEADDNASTVSPQPDEGNEDGSKGHLYPYGQKELPDERVDRAIIQECTLYVTVEPCVMCASMLRQLGIKKVFFGAVNDKFGGTGGVFSIHANSLPVRDDGQTASAHPQPPPMRLPNGKQVLGTSFPISGGDGGNVEAGYEIEGGWGRDEAVGLLRRFYVQENGRAPVPRKKEGRAARLAAMMENDGASINSGSASGGMSPDDDDQADDTHRNDESERGMVSGAEVCRGERQADKEAV